MKFDETVKLYAIRVYLNSYGYKAQVYALQYAVYVQDPIGYSFVVRSISNWKVAREFIAIRSKS